MKFDYKLLLSRLLDRHSSTVRADEVEMLERGALFISGTPVRLSLDRHRVEVNGRLNSGPPGAFVRVTLGRGARISVKPVTSTKDEPGQRPMRRIRINAPDAAGIQATVAGSKVQRLGGLMEIHVVGRHRLTFHSPTRVLAAAWISSFHANAEQAPAQAQLR